MKGDFSRIRFNRRKHYTSVLQQQGRVALDADTNEQCAINEHLRDTETKDVVGLYGGPSGYEGFAITVSGNQILIGAGRYYVHGILCENEQDSLASLAYTEQPFLINPSPTDADLLEQLQVGTITTIQVYLEVWQRLVTALDDPCLREPALGQADTTARVQTVWRVVAQGIAAVQPASSTGSVQAFESSVLKETVRQPGLGMTTGAPVVSPPSGSRPPIFPLPPIRFPQPQPIPGQGQTPGDCCADMYQPTAQEGPPGRLSARTNDTSDPCSCEPTPPAGYRGLENQLYRIEIHQSGDETSATFKWSRENGSVVMVVTGVSGRQVYVDSLGPDANLGFSVGQWVEITDDSYLFGQVPNQPGNLYQIQSITPEQLTMTMTDVVAAVDLTKNPRLRRWDQFGSAAGSGGVALSVGSWLDLENGIQVQFASGQYQSGDYWLIPARTASGQIDWPPCDSDGNPCQPAHRMEVFQAPLACIQWVNDQLRIEDCRNKFDNLVELTKRPEICCTVVVGPHDLTGNMTLQTIVDRAATPTMFVQAASPGISGNNITVEISNVNRNSHRSTFDLTVRETAVYRGLATGGSTGIEGAIGDEESNLPNAGPLAHILVGSVNTNNTNVFPEDNQDVALTGGEAGTAQGNIVDSTNIVVFTLQARSGGADGNLTHAKITNLDTSPSPPTFDLTLTWSKTLTALSMDTLLQQIQNNLSYEIVAQPPPTVPAVLPAEGVTMLSGGTEGNSNTGSSALPAHAGIFGNPGKVCLRTGTYYLAAPVILGPEHSNITIESCGGGPAVLSMLPQPAVTTDLLQGLMVLNSARNVTLSGLRFSMPPPVRLVGRDSLTHLDPKPLQGMIGKVVPGGTEVATILTGLFGSVGVRPMGCTNLRVENCSFDFKTEFGLDFPGALLQAGILAGGANSALTLLNNHFEGQLNPILLSDRFLQLRVGYLLAPSVDLTRFTTTPQFQQASINEATNERITVREGGTVSAASLQDACFQGNVFRGLEAPLLIFSECGAVALEDNTITDCYSGPWIIARRAPPDVAKVTGEPEPVSDVRVDPIFVAMVALAQCYPVPKDFTDPQALTIPSPTIVLTGAPFQNPVLAFLNALLELGFGLTQAASQLISATELNLYCHVVSNKITTYALPAWAGSTGTGPGLVIWGEDTDFNTEVILNSNRIENSSAPVTPTVVIVQIQNCTMTGNLIFNDYDSTKDGSLYLGPLSPTLSPSITVMGNLFNANTNLSSLVSPAAQTVGMGNGTNTVFNSTLAQHPIQPNSVTVLDGPLQVGTDNGGGTIIGSAGLGLQGTIEYESGASFLTFASAPATGTAITISYLYSKWLPLNGP